MRREAKQGRSMVFRSVVFVLDEENDVAGFR